MDILLATTTYPPDENPLAGSVAATAAELETRGERVLVATPDRPGSDPGTRPRVVPLRSAAEGRPLDLRAVDLPADFRPALVHAFDPFTSGPAALAFAYGQGIPLLLTQPVLYRNHASALGDASAGEGAYLAALSTRFSAFCSRVLAPDATTAAELERRRVRAPVVELPLGIPDAWFPTGREVTAPARGEFVVGVAGRLAREERTPLLLATLRRVLEAAPAARGLVAGTGPLLPAARELRDSIHPPGRLRVVAPRGVDHLRREVRDLGVLLLGRAAAAPPGWEPLVQASGVPVLVAGSGPEAIPRLARDVLELAALSDEARARGRARLRRRAEARRMSRVAAALQELYREVVLADDRVEARPSPGFLEDLARASAVAARFWRAVDADPRRGGAAVAA